MPENDRVAELMEVELLLSALGSIINESNDAESVRMATSALTNTEMGRTYLRANPIQF